MLLAIDTATRKIGIALYDGIEILHEAVWLSNFRHSVELSPAIEQALTRANKSIQDIEVIALAIGPGSYTGLRIGAAVAKGMAFARHLPLVGISTFDILAYAQPVVADEQLAVLIEAGRKRLSVCFYEAKEGKWQAVGEPDIMTAEELANQIKTPTHVCGELNEQTLKALNRKRKNISLVTPARGLRRPAFLAELAWQRFENNDLDDAASLAPQYLQTA